MGLSSNANAARIHPVAALPAAADFGDVDEDFRKLVEAVNDRLRRIDVLIPSTASGGALIVDTHAHRVNYNPASYAGWLYYETDRRALYTPAPDPAGKNAPAWRFLSGSVIAYAQGAYPGDLGRNDAGFRIWVAGYRHILVWDINATGGAWGFEASDPGSAFIQLFAIAPAGGFHLCDGTAGVSYLKSDGTTATITLPNLSGSPAYLKTGAAYTGTINAAGQTGTPSGTTTVQSGAGATVASSGHTHTEGDPANLVLLPYFRL